MRRAEFVEEKEVAEVGEGGRQKKKKRGKTITTTLGT